MAITLPDNVLANKKWREKALTGPALPSGNDMRIAPSGQIYIKEKKASLEEAFALIARKKEKDQVRVCVAPPYRRYHGVEINGEFKDADALAQSVDRTFQELVKYGETHGIGVFQDW